MNTKTADGLGTQLRRLLELLDGDLEDIYKQDGHGFLPRYTPVMKALATKERRTIKEIASLSSISHSAASQTVSRMKANGLVESHIADDGRARLIALTKRGQGLLPLLRARWDATQQAARQLDSELSCPLSQVVTEAISALSDRSFRARISECESSEADSAG